MKNHSLYSHREKCISNIFITENKKKPKKLKNLTCNPEYVRKLPYKAVVLFIILDKFYVEEKMKTELITLMSVICPVITLVYL